MDRRLGTDASACGPSEAPEDSGAERGRRARGTRVGPASAQESRGEDGYRRNPYFNGSRASMMNVFSPVI